MALLAESLVEEWLNRTGFFTIRGVKHGVGEMDLLAVRAEPDGTVVGRHVEVQVSFRPVGYICKRTDEMVAEFGGSMTSAKARTSEQVDLCAQRWVENKFRHRDKARLRAQLWPGINWSFHFVHAVVREQRELQVFADEGVICHPFHELLTNLSTRSKGFYSGSAGGDLAEIVGYYKSHNPNQKIIPSEDDSSSTLRALS